MLLFLVTLTWAQRSINIKGRVLMDSLHVFSQPVRVLSYGGGDNKTWSGFKITDMMDGNVVRDRYSNTIRRFGQGNEAVGGMNIEHIWANSWWGHKENFAYKDLYNLYPSDSEANQRKSNNPIGVVTGTVAYQNGVVKIGKGVDPGNGTSQTVWEPADKWKGDFARTYFYMATTYSNFGTFVVPEGSPNKGLNIWTTAEGLRTVDPNSPLVLREGVYKLMLKWAAEDPVDQIERDRCDAIEKIQGNRNPYVDIPELCEYVWGSKQNEYFDYARVKATMDPSINIDPNPDPSTTVVVSITPEVVYMTAVLGAESPVTKLAVYMNNVTKPQLTATVEKPFMLSLNGTTWTNSVTTTYATQPFYVKFCGADLPGLYESEIECSVPGADPKVVSISCDVDDKYAFFENFEVGSKGAYAQGDVKCNSATWNMKDALIASDDNSNDNKSVRIKSGGNITMLTEKAAGCNILSFYTGLYGNDTGLKLTAEYSVDGGSTWKTIVRDLAVGTWKQYHYPVKADGNIRLRFTCSGTSSKRINLDDIRMTDFQPTVQDVVDAVDKYQKGQASRSNVETIVRKVIRKL